MSSPPPPPSLGSTRLVARMTEILRQRGAPYPMAGALACAVRGRLALSPEAFAVEFDLFVDTVEAAECGSTPLAALPDAITDRIPWLGLDLTLLIADEAA